MGRDSQDAYHLWLVGRAYADDTIRGYLGVLHVWQGWCRVHGVALARASQADITRWLLERRHLASNTRRNNIIALRILYRFLGGPNPTEGLRLPRLQLPPVQPYSQEDLLRLRDACRKPRDLALFYMLLGSGLRACEVMRLRRPDVKWERGLLEVHGKGGKERLVPLAERALEALAACEDGFGMTKVSGLKMWIRRLGARAGVRPAGLQRFRVSYACRLLEAGADLGALQILMGHSDVSQTAHYAAFTARNRALEQGRRLSPADALFSSDTV